MLKNNLSNKKIGVVSLQLGILIISVFAFCYLISDSEVNAQTVEGYGCCEESIDGHTCQYLPIEKCNENFKISPNLCDNAVFCGDKGCCISSETGVCNKNTYERDCNGEWVDNSLCQISQCEKGCCILGSQAKWITEKECEVESVGEVDFRQDVKSEVECIFLTQKEDEGACVFYLGNEKKCIFTTRGDCVSRTGSENNFYFNTYCSNSELNASCEKEDHKACVEGKPSVYWVDSCGNPEKIAEGCSIFDGTICGLENDEYKCKSLDCVDENGKKWKNGESWCEYEGTIGNGRDVVGSRHIKKLCIMGEIKTEPCSDYRNQICVQQDTKINNGEIFSEAACRINNWRSCINYNVLEEDDEEKEKKCKENPDCFLKEVKLSNDLKFNICVPSYPPGFDLSNSNTRTSAELVCNFASQNCTILCEKKLSWKFWDPKEKCQNAVCETEKFTQEMNDLCTSLGDCGAYVNYVGDITDDGYSIKNGVKLTQAYLNKEIRPYSNEKKGQKASPGNLSVLGIIFGMPESLGNVQENEIPEWIDPFRKTLFGVSGALGVPLLLNNFGLTAGLGESITNFYSTISGLSSTTVLGFANVAAGAAAGNGLALLAINMWSINGDAATLLEILGTLMVPILIGLGWNLPVALLITFGILSIFGSLLRHWGYGETRKAVIYFKCLPWQPPSGGEKCELCNKDEFCTDYKCQSLGQNCMIINKGTKEEACVNVPPTDITSTKIKPLYNFITQDYEYYNVKDTGFQLVNSQDKGCIEAFTPIQYGIQTDKRAQCKIDIDPQKRYDEMQDYFGNIGETNAYLINHTTLILMPSPSVIQYQYNLTDEQTEQISDVNFYIKCKNLNDVINEVPYVIKICVKPGPDLTAPMIVKTNPENNAYVKYGETEQDLEVYVNEPAECKWSKDDKSYESIENEMQCNQDLEDYSLYGWKCSTKLTGLNENNKFYIRCQDIAGNKMAESYEYELTNSASNLVINNFRPLDGAEIISGVEPIQISLKLETSGGVEDQSDTLCSWEGNGYSDLFRFTDNNIYTYDVSLTNGRYNINFQCTDTAGNSAEASTSFSLKIDNSGPKITRVYYDDGLKIITNENAECRYGFDKKFIFDNSTKMSNKGTEHTINWEPKTYYIQCKDEFDNKGGILAVKKL